MKEDIIDRFFPLLASLRPKPKNAQNFAFLDTLRRGAPYAREAQKRPKNIFERIREFQNMRGLARPAHKNPLRSPESFAVEMIPLLRYMPKYAAYAALSPQEVAQQENDVKQADNWGDQVKQIENRGVWANMADNLGDQFQQNANRAVKYGAGGNAPLIGGMAAGLGVVRDLLNAKSNRQSYKLLEQQRRQQEEDSATLQALRADLERRQKIEDRDEQRRYNENLYQQHYGQTRADEDRRYDRNLSEEERRYMRALSDEDKRYNRNRQDQESTYQQHRFQEQNDKILPKLSLKDRQFAYANPGVERFAEPEYPEILRTVTLGRAFNGIHLPREKAKEFEKYRKNKIADANRNGYTLSDAEIMNSFMKSGE